MISREDAKEIIARMERGETHTAIFAELPSFAYAEFRELLFKHTDLQRLYESVSSLKAHHNRDKLRDMATQRLDRREVAGARLQFDILKHLIQQEDPDLITSAADGGAVAAHAVVYVPTKEPPGLAAETQKALATETETPPEEKTPAVDVEFEESL